MRGSAIAVLTLAVLVTLAAADSCPVSEHVHTAKGAESRNATDGYSFIVSWKTTYASGPYTPTVYYGFSPEDATHVVPRAASDCTTTNYWGSDYHYSCYVRGVGLKPSTDVFYRVGNATCMGNVYKYTTGPAPGVLAEAIMFGDLGVDQSAGTLRVMQDLLAQRGPGTPVIHVGDISYADDANLIGDNPDYEPILNKFMAQVEPVASRFAYMVAPGNHDVSCHILGDSGCSPKLTNFSAYRGRWRMPSTDSGSSTTMWYSFNHGNIHFVSINTETDYPLAPYTPTAGSARAGGFGDQLRWLEQDLQQANRKEARAERPWVVVYGHRPLYSTNSMDFPFDQQDRVRKTFEPLFSKYGVDLYVCGHVHMYERTLPMLDGKPTSQSYDHPPSTVYVNNGAGGNVEGHCNHYTQDIPAYIPIRDVTHYGVGLLRTANSTTYLKAAANTYKSVEGSDALLRSLMLEQIRHKVIVGTRTGDISLCYDFVPSATTTGKPLASAAPLDSFCITKALPAMKKLG